MKKERKYVTSEGHEYILGARVMYNNIRFLLLLENKSEEVFVAYEKDNDLNFINEDYPDYSNILSMLYEEFKNQI